MDSQYKIIGFLTGLTDEKKPIISIPVSEEHFFELVEKCEKSRLSNKIIINKNTIEVLIINDLVLGEIHKRVNDKEELIAYLYVYLISEVKE
jgi:hypothetical protein